MSALISGVLKDGMGKPIPNCTIELKAERTSATVITKTIASQKPEENGSYSMNVEAGKYSVTLCVEGYPPNHVGEIYVHSESVPGTLNYYLGLPTEGDLPPAAIQQFEEMVALVAKQAAQVEKDKAAAAQSAADALASKNAAKTSETNANNSANDAAASAQAAKISETNAANSKKSAQASAADGLASQNAAKASEIAANGSKVAAAQSAVDALASKNAAKASETNAGKSADGAAASAQAAKTSETSSGNSKEDAAQSAADALASKNAAKTSETNANNSANDAAASAQSAKISETDAANSKKSAQASAADALASQNAAKTSEDNAGASKIAAAQSAVTAKTEADRAAGALASKQDKSEILTDLSNSKDADGVREYLGLNDVASSGENSDITHITGLTTPLSLKQGGTGAIDAAKAKSNLGLGSTDVVTFGHMNLERYDGSNVSASGILNLMNYNTDGSVRKARARIYEEIRQDGRHWLTLHLQVGDSNQYWGFQENGNFNSPKGISTNWMKTTSDGEGYVNINSGPNQSNYIVGKASDGSNIWYAGKGSASNNNVQVRNYVGDCSLGVLENGNVELLTKGNKGEVSFTGRSTRLYSGESDRNWRNEIFGTPTKDCYNRYWGISGRPCVYEVGFESTYCTYTQINTDGSIVFNVNGNVTCRTLTQTSDIALKDNIVAIDNALDKISKLNGYTFTWKDSGLPSAGVIAQEVMEVLPEIISTTRDEAGSNSLSDEGSTTFEQKDEGSRHYAVEYSGLIGLLISGINEERRNREEMEIKVTALQERLTSLEEIFENLPLNKAPTQS